MNKREKLFKLFGEVFKFENNTNLKEKFKVDKFECGCLHKCEVNLEKEASYTAWWGEEKSDIMLVAEAPSTAGGEGAFWAGDYESMIDTKGNFNKLKEYFEESTDSYPHFTDLIKCGFEKQNDKSKLKIRVKNCTEKFLLKEIKILNPAIIICVGTQSRDFFETLKEENQSILKNIDIIYLMHYSGQAFLPLTIDDKVNIIWPIQMGTKKPDGPTLSKLSYFKEEKWKVK